MEKFANAFARFQRESSATKSSYVFSLSLLADYSFLDDGLGLFDLLVLATVALLDDVLSRAAAALHERSVGLVELDHRR